MSGYEVEPAELFAAEAMVNEAAGEARAQLARLQAAADDLLGHGWRGRAAAAFGQGWKDWSDGARAMIAALDSTGRALGVTAGDYEASETTNTIDLRKIA